MCLFRNIILFRQKGKDGIYKPSVITQKCDMYREYYEENMLRVEV